MKKLFWRFAYWRYNQRKPSLIFEVVGIGFGSLFVLMYLLAVYLNPVLSNGVRVIGAGLIVCIGIAHRRVRLEREKGPDALYRKMLSTTG